MPMNIPLLDVMALQMGCEYLSDLHYIDDHQRLHLARQLEKVEARDTDLFEWNDALEYLAGVKTPCSSAEQAKAALIAALSAHRSGRWRNAKIPV